HIQNEQGKMLNSLLDYSYNKVKINRVLDQKEENLLIYSIEMSDKWQEIYKLQDWINECIYEELNRTVSEEEWFQTLTELANITKELNLLDCGKEVLELRLKQSFLQAGCIE
ncbi:27027_t:CDS:2, partial [Gigaspora margarita]